MKNIIFTILLTFMSICLAGQKSVTTLRSFPTDGFTAVCLNAPVDTYQIQTWGEDYGRWSLTATGPDINVLNRNFGVGRYQPAMTVSNDTLWITVVCMFNPQPNEILTCQLFLPGRISVIQTVRPINEVRFMQKFVQ